MAAVADEDAPGRAPVASNELRAFPEVMVFNSFRRLDAEPRRGGEDNGAAGG